MISYENEIFTKIATRLREEFNGIFVASILNLNPTQFPCVFIEEADNYPYYRSGDTKSIENHAVVMHEVNVFSNKVSGKRTEAKAIMRVIDEEYQALGFRRQTIQPLSLDDSTKYRIASRYTAVIDDNHTVYRR